MTKKYKDSGYFQLTGLKGGLHAAVKVAAAMDRCSMQAWITEQIRAAVKRKGIIIEEEQNEEE